MEPTDITIEILKGIREELRGTNGRLDSVNGRLDSVNAQIGDLRAAQNETNARLGSHGLAIVKLISEVHDLNERFDNFLHGAHHEDHADLRARVGRLEAKVG